MDMRRYSGIRRTSGHARFATRKERNTMNHSNMWGGEGGRTVILRKVKFAKRFREHRQLCYPWHIYRFPGNKNYEPRL